VRKFFYFFKKLGKELRINDDTPEYQSTFAPRNADYYAVEELKTYEELKSNIQHLLNSDKMKNWQLAGHMLLLSSQHFHDMHDAPRYPGATVFYFMQMLEEEADNYGGFITRPNEVKVIPVGQDSYFWNLLKFKYYVYVTEEQFKPLYEGLKVEYDKFISENHSVVVNYC